MTLEVVPEVHIHYWLIEPPMGEFSAAVCKRCGAAKVFANSPDALRTPWRMKKKQEAVEEVAG